MMPVMKYLLDQVKQVNNCFNRKTYPFLNHILAPGVVQLTTSVVSNTEVNVIWSPPSQPNGIITAYKVIYSIYDNTTTVMSELLSDDRSTYPISDLSKLMYRVPPNEDCP